MRSIASMLFLLALSPNFAIGGVLTFDDLSAPPAVTGSATLFDANGGSAVYGGVTFDSNFVVVGDEYRIDTATPGPVFGIPHSGHYFVTNASAGAVNGLDALTITTDQVLTGSWWGRNEYYGFGGGAVSITIKALDGSNVLQSLTFDLPAPTVAGQPSALEFFDTSAFASLTGITGYEIDRTPADAGHPNSANWVADDFTFVPSTQAVPEPSTICLFSLGLVAIGISTRRRRRDGASAT